LQPSASHFATFDNFVPDGDASFDDEFARLASSQQWAPGSQQYTRQRTIAISQELKLHYFSQARPRPSTIEEGDEDEDGDDCGDGDDDADDLPRAAEPTEEELKLRGYQALCTEVGISSLPDTIGECTKALKNTLVNIIDLINVRRCPGTKVSVWDDFEAFRRYTLQPKRRISLEDAKGTVLESLLQTLRTPRSRTRARAAARKPPVASAVVAGRVKKERGQ